MKLMIFSYRGAGNNPLDSTFGSNNTLVIVFGTLLFDTCDLYNPTMTLTLAGESNASAT